MHRIIYSPHNTPVAITNLFHTNSSIHQHNTRHKHEFHIHSSVCKSSLSFLGPSLWIKLPTVLKACVNYKEFQKNTKKFYLTNCKL